MGTERERERVVLGVYSVVEARGRPPISRLTTGEPDSFEVLKWLLWMILAGIQMVQVTADVKGRDVYKWLLPLSSWQLRRYAVQLFN